MLCSASAEFLTTQEIAGAILLLLLFYPRQSHWDRRENIVFSKLNKGGAPVTGVSDIETSKAQFTYPQSGFQVKLDIHTKSPDIEACITS